MSVKSNGLWYNITYIIWGIILKNGTELDFRPAFNEDSSIPGITGSYVNGTLNTLLITVNTTETSVIGLICFTTVHRFLVRNTTIYGKL